MPIQPFNSCIVFDPEPFRPHRTSNVFRHAQNNYKFQCHIKKNCKLTNREHSPLYKHILNCRPVGYLQETWCSRLWLLSQLKFVATSPVMMGLSLSLVMNLQKIKFEIILEALPRKRVSCKTLTFEWQWQPCPNCTRFPQDVETDRPAAAQGEHTSDTPRKILSFQLNTSAIRNLLLELCTAETRANILQNLLDGFANRSLGARSSFQLSKSWECNGIRT